jgi:hypothetical protein
MANNIFSNINFGGINLFNKVRKTKNLIKFQKLANRRKSASINKGL